MANQSHSAFVKAMDANDFMVFKNIMQSLVKAYNQLYRVPLWKRIVVKAKKLILK